MAGVALNHTIGMPVVWLSASKELLVRMVPPGRGPAPKQPAAPAGPNVQELAGTAVPTYQDMLKSPHDERLFEYYCTSQLAAVDVATGKVTPIGKPGIFWLARHLPRTGPTCWCP